MAVCFTGSYVGIILVAVSLFQKNLAYSSEEMDRSTLKELFRQLPRVDFSMATATDPDRIIYKLYTKNNPDQEIILTEKNVESHKMDKNVKTVLFIHGWTGDDTSPWYGVAKKNYFQDGSYNIIYIDWSAFGNLSFAVSAANVKPVGEFIARFLKKSQVVPKNIHIAGHSMGGQLGGFIGKSYSHLYGEKIGRITGLDPSGRMFSNPNMRKEERLNELDAEFVDVIHTDIQVYGFTKPCGHVDFYPNGGADQPGCQNEESIEKCNHDRSNWFFVESIITSIKAMEINFKEDENYNVIVTSKENPKEVVFGEKIDLNATGVYYFRTNPTKPFLS